jgi:hypothetical protein
MATRAGVALGTVGPVMKDLEAPGYLRYRREPDPGLFDPERMVAEWVTRYPITLRRGFGGRCIPCCARFERAERAGFSGLLTNRKPTRSLRRRGRHRGIRQIAFCWE